MLRLVIFDLDDTLYPEVQYVESGFRAVTRYLSWTERHWRKPAEYLINLWRTEPSRVFDRVASEMYPEDSGQQQAMVRGMLTAYRHHQPEIRMYDDSMPAIERLRACGVMTAVITDGRVEGQVNKIKALGLAGIMDEIIITDALGPDRQYWKPHPRAFEQVLEELSVAPRQACYVGDNLAKDFIAPKALGMSTVLVTRPDGLYRAEPSRYHAVDLVVGDLQDLVCWLVHCSG
jgi:putative hydrolase of the HAD superfamily